MSNDPNQQPQSQMQASVPAIDPQQYYATQQELVTLRQERQQFEQFFDRIDPYSGTIKRMLEDENAAGVMSNAIAAYDSAVAAQKPKIDPAWDPQTNPYVAKIDKLTDFAERWDKQQQAQAQQAQEQANQQAVTKAREYLDDLAKKFPLLRENENAGLRGIIAMTQTEGISLEDAAERMKPLYAPTAASAAPSLRPDQGAPGVPGPSLSTVGVGNIAARAAEILRANGLGR